MGCLALFVVGLVVVVGEAHLGNNLVHDDALPTCADLLHGAAPSPLSLTATLPPDPRGRWLSTSCETRPGPRYVLRSYTLQRDGSFHLALHTYRDPSCARPSHTLAARGNLTLGRPSWVTQGATEAEYTITRVEVVAHTHRDAALVADAVNTTCPGKVTKPWKPHKPYTVLAYTETANEVTVDEDCSKGLGGAWNELQLLRVEITEEARKGTQKEGGDRVRKELFLGDLHTDVSKQDLYRPTGYQQPLLNSKYAGECGVCGALGRSNDRSPAHLHAGPALPILLLGAWASHRCETRPYGMFLTRHLLFRRGDEWTMRLSYYHDPDCSRPSFTLQASGTHAPATPTRHTAPDHHAHDFNVTRLLLTPEDSYLTSALNFYNEKECGARGKWMVRKAQDVTPTGGCSAVGVRVPVVEREIILTGVDEAGGVWLRLGQTPTTTRLLSGTRRPTSWGPPLLACRQYRPRPPNSHHNALRPMVGARTASLAPSTSSHASTGIIFVMVLFVKFFYP